MDADFTELMNDRVWIRPRSGRSAFGTTQHGPERGPFRVRWEAGPRMSRTTPGEEEYGTHFVVFDGDPCITTEDMIRLPDGTVEKVSRVETTFVGGKAHHTEVFLSSVPGGRA